jgi:tRNA (pseudouridine54-N1)-methyltransferase
MRRFVVLGHEAPVDPDFSLDDLAGGAGRLDALCRCINAAFCLSHAIREDVRVFLVLRDEVTVRFEGADLRYLSPDERNIASLIREALDAKGETVGHREVESTPGIHVSTRGFEPVLDRVRGTVIQLHEDGDPVTELAPPADPVFVVSDHRSFTDPEVDLLADRVDRRVSLGPRALHGDDAITVAHNYLDTDGFASY